MAELWPRLETEDAEPGWRRRGRCWAHEVGHPRGSCPYRSWDGFRTALERKRKKDREEEEEGTQKGGDNRRQWRRRRWSDDGEAYRRSNGGRNRQHCTHTVETVFDRGDDYLARSPSFTLEL